MHLKLSILVTLALISLAFGKGIIELDDISWPKIVDGSKPVLVAFTEYSWKDPKVSKFSKLSCHVVCRDMNKLLKN
jgi:hypothetical protein